MIEDLTIEDFVYTYVEWLPGMTFEEAHSLAIDRDQQAANVLLQDIKSGGAQQ